MQLTLLTVNVVLCALILLQSPTNATPTTVATTPTPEVVTSFPPLWPLCCLPPVCPARSPRVCGRNSNGMCRRFNNICELLELNRRDLSTSSKVTWFHTQERDCRRVRGVGASHAFWCHEDCPRRPVKCRRTPQSQQICVRTRNLKACKVVANRCQLLNNNCHMRPRNNWLPTNRRRCGQMQLADKAQACLPVPLTGRPEVTRITAPILTIAPTTVRTATTQRPRPANATTTG